MSARDGRSSLASRVRKGRSEIRSPRREIGGALSDGAREDIPYPIVMYPGHYGVFMGFKENENAPICLCACAYEAIHNYILLRLAFPIHNTFPDRNFVLSSKDFPQTLIEKLMSSDAPGDIRVMDHLRFEERLCHECNGATPSYDYCSPAYGGVFKRTYGWYIIKQAYEFGIMPITNWTLKEQCPQEILELMGEDFIAALDEYRRTNGAWTQSLLHANKPDSKARRRVWKIIENEVRRKFGHREVGEAWSSETILFYMVKRLFPELSVLRHHRPAYLQGLEFDIFIEDLNLAIEYQGIQHFQPVEHWGGENSFMELQRRDEKKRVICESQGIRLEYFGYLDDLSEEYVAQRLGPVNSDARLD